MKLYIKNIVNLLGEEQVKEELKKLKIHFGLIDSGMVELFDHLDPKKHNKLKINLITHGLKLQDAGKVILVEKIKRSIEEMIRYTDGMPIKSYSLYLSMGLHYDYTYLSNIFSEVNGFSIQQHIIESKIERVKELFQSSDLSLSEISYLLHYSSVAHLSSQFKKTTGLSPSCYKLIMHQEEDSFETN
ncbi:MAG: helix-turn-helix domain-containing protein [Psychroflexus sp.]